MPTNISIASDQIAFVFNDLMGWQQLVASIPAGVEVVVLDGTRDGLVQMADALQGRSGIGAVHIYKGFPIKVKQISNRDASRSDESRNAFRLT